MATEIVASWDSCRECKAPAKEAQSYEVAVRLRCPRGHWWDVPDILLPPHVPWRMTT